MALLNNIVEFPSDAFKLVTHFRRPIPQRTDTIGPWLDCLSFLTWLSTLTNSALVFLFRDPHHAASKTTTASGEHGPHNTCGVAVSRALLIALAASHGYIVLRAAVRHILERLMWVGSPEKARMDTTAREVKERYAQGIIQGTPGLGPLDPPTPVAATATTADAHGQTSAPPPPSDFWEFDEGLDEIRKGIKDS